MNALTTIADRKNLETMVRDGKFKQILNSEPPKTWVKDNPVAKGVKYLPIDKVELLLDSYFQGRWHVEVREIKQLAQSICCVVRLHYCSPITGEWSFQDGVGAVPLKTDKGCTAADLAHIKSDAVATGAPSAKSFAIKDAAEELGKVFGRDLNRKDAIAYKTLYEDLPEAEQPQEDGEETVEADPLTDEEEAAIELINTCRTKQDLFKLWTSEQFQNARQSDAVQKAKDWRKTRIEAEMEEK